MVSLVYTGIGHVTKGVANPSLIHLCCNVVTSVLFVLAVTVIMTVLKRRAPENRPKGLAGWQIRFMIMMFASCICFFVDGPGNMFVGLNIYYAQLCLAAKALINSLVFTIVSKAFFKSVKRSWIILRYKCGRPLHVLDIHSEEGESQDPLIIIPATENRIDVWITCDFYPIQFSS